MHEQRPKSSGKCRSIFSKSAISKPMVCQACVLHAGRLSRKRRKSRKNNETAKENEDNSGSCYKQGSEWWIFGNHRNHGNDENHGNLGCKPPAPRVRKFASQQKFFPANFVLRTCRPNKFWLSNLRAQRFCDSKPKGPCKTSRSMSHSKFSLSHCLATIYDSQSPSPWQRQSSKK